MRFSDHPDSTGAKAVKALKPVHRDAAPRSKSRSNRAPTPSPTGSASTKRPETVLQVTRPRPENLTGREAHDRVEAILRETLDVGLWKALRIQQGTGVDQASLLEGTSLAAALDGAAGGAEMARGEETLLQRVEEEYAKYYTEKRGLKKEVVELRSAREDSVPRWTTSPRSSRPSRGMWTPTSPSRRDPRPQGGFPAMLEAEWKDLEVKLRVASRASAANRGSSRRRGRRRGPSTSPRSGRPGTVSARGWPGTTPP
jgi:hypothetical protein